MNTSLTALRQWTSSNGAMVQGLSAPLLVVAILALMVLPIPAWLLDTFFTLNIAVALMVMMVAAYMIRPLDFAAFPSVLLLTTLMRLSLNVASTRVVLLEGHTGPGAAGAVIEAFGHFLIGGNFAVGLIVFAILVVINFVVVTKGAERIAEVSARFTLDAMPGKQMAVDADLNAGLINEDEAKRRRAVLQDLTCDSDGKVRQYVDQQSIETSMPIHEPRAGEPYLLGVFMVGAYQEILGDMHNLFGDTDSVNVYVRDDGRVEYGGMEEHDTIEDMLRYVHLSPEEVLNKFEEKSRWARLGKAEHNLYFAEFCRGLKQSSYLSLEAHEHE